MAATFLAFALAELSVVYALPLAAGVASGAWAACAQYFGPVAIMVRWGGLSVCACVCVYACVCVCV
jgi:hypothetical protein